MRPDWLCVICRLYPTAPDWAFRICMVQLVVGALGIAGLVAMVVTGLKSRTRHGTGKGQDTK